MVKVQPRARRPGLQGMVASTGGDRLKLAVTEAAEDGWANQAVCDLMARALEVPRSAVRIVTGATSREKLLAVTGDPAELASRLRALLPALPL